jgi:hypothetical protein
VSAQQRCARGTGGTLDTLVGIRPPASRTLGSGLAVIRRRSRSPSSGGLGVDAPATSSTGGGDRRRTACSTTRGRRRRRAAERFLADQQQHAFVRGAERRARTILGARTRDTHDSWGGGITGDPTAERIDAQQHVWAQDAAGAVQHWYWDPSTNAIAHDNWGQ